MFKSVEEVGEFFVFDFLFGNGFLNNKMIIVDLGYGGKDSGIIGYLGKFEKNLMIKMVKLFVSKFRLVGVDVYVICQDDIFVSLQLCVFMFYYCNVDVFISIYYDSYVDIFMRGSIVYYYSFVKDEELVLDVYFEVVKCFFIFDCGVLFGDYYVFWENRQFVMLYELGYVSYLQEEVIVYSNLY